MRNSDERQSREMPFDASNERILRRKQRQTEPSRRRNAPKSPRQPVPLLGRQLILEPPKEGRPDHLIYRTPFLYALSKEETEDALFDFNGQAGLKYAAESALPELTTEHVELERFNPPEDGKSFMVGVLGQVASARNLKWINPIRQGLCLEPYPDYYTLRVPFYVMQLDRSDTSTLNRYLNVAIPLGPIATSTLSE